jgi:hypothetical protein
MVMYITSSQSTYMYITVLAYDTWLILQVIVTVEIQITTVRASSFCEFEATASIFRLYDSYSEGNLLLF